MGPGELAHGVVQGAIRLTPAEDGEERWRRGGATRRRGGRQRAPPGRVLQDGKAAIERRNR